MKVFVPVGSEPAAGEREIVSLGVELDCCEECGAAVLDFDRHREWHAKAGR